MDKAVDGAPPDLERELRFSPTNSEGAAAALRRHGLVIIDNLWPAQRIEDYAAAIAHTYPEVLDERQKSLDQTHVVGDSRQISPLVFGGDLACTDILLNPVLDGLLKFHLGETYVFEAFGVIISHPGAPRQTTHSDGPTLFGRPELDRLLPPFAINVAIPLVTMDISLGTTGFWPGSHIALPDLKLNDQDMISPIMPTGSLALWDFRTKHCGLANQGDRVRPLLYATACRPFWADHGNFKRGRDLKLLVDPETLESFDKPNRKKFARAQLFSAGARPWQLPDS